VAEAATVRRVVSVAHRLSRDSCARVRTDFNASESGTDLDSFSFLSVFSIVIFVCLVVFTLTYFLPSFIKSVQSINLMQY